MFSFSLIKKDLLYQAAMGTMDFIIDTIAAVHQLAPLLDLLKMNGKLVTVGLPDKPLELPIFPLVLGKKILPSQKWCFCVCVCKQCF